MFIELTYLIFSFQIRPYSLKKSDMELKLVHEIRDFSDSKTSPVKESTPSRGTTSTNPQSMLISELFESVKAKGSTAKAPLAERVSEPAPTNEIDFKANLRKVSKINSDETEKARTPTQIDFKSQLKKKPSSEPHKETSNSQDNSSPKDKSNNDETTNLVDFKSKLRKSTKPETSASANLSQNDSPEPVDFKSRLRKVSGSGKPSTPTQHSPSNNDDEQLQERRDSLDQLDAQDKLDSSDKRDSLGSIEENEKRRSTGSISSLRKMWESSPKIGGRKSSQQPEEVEAADQSPEAAPVTSGTVKYEKRVWPPVPNTEMEKPMVPVKPTVKPPAPTTKPPPPKESPVSGIKIAPKPAMAVKPNVCNIYASPSVVQPKPRPPTKTVPTKNGSTNDVNEGLRSDGEGKGREALLEVSQKLETRLDAAKRDTSKMSKFDLSNLSDQIGLFHTNCSALVDSVPPTSRYPNPAFYC
jgi:hypothetical protein